MQDATSSTISATSPPTSPSASCLSSPAVSGSGKSTLVNDILYRSLAKELYGSREDPGKHKAIHGASEQLDKVIQIDQSPIGRTPRSNPCHLHRRLHRDPRSLRHAPRITRARLQARPLSPSTSRAAAVKPVTGDGQRRIEMNFLPDVYVLCEICNGRRYNQETLAVKVQRLLYSRHPRPPDRRRCADPQRHSRRPTDKLQTLVDVGLGYIHLGQSATTLSGGEAQRMKLARELSKRQTGTHPLPSRRAHHRSSLRRRAQAPRSPPPPHRPRQHRHHHRAQPRHHPQTPTTS